MQANNAVRDFILTVAKFKETFVELTDPETNQSRQFLVAVWPFPNTEPIRPSKSFGPKTKPTKPSALKKKPASRKPVKTSMRSVKRSAGRK